MSQGIRNEIPIAAVDRAGLSPRMAKATDTEVVEAP
jgi:hypothetical protein